MRIGRRRRRIQVVSAAEGRRLADEARANWEAGVSPEMRACLNRIEEWYRDYRRNGGKPIQFD